MGIIILSTMDFDISLNVAPLPRDFRYSTLNSRTQYKYLGRMDLSQIMFLNILQLETQLHLHFQPLDFIQLDSHNTIFLHQRQDSHYNLFYCFSIMDNLYQPQRIRGTIKSSKHSEFGEFEAIIDFVDDSANSIN